MPTISQQLTELVNQKNALANNLVAKGVEASTDETLNTLVPKVLDIQTGGGGNTNGKYLVRVIDYDGSILKEEHLDTGATFTLPDSPTHEKLIFQNWSSPVNITDNSIIVDNSDITIGATYKTASGLTEIDITLTKVTGLDVTCNMVGNKNWGDGTEDNLTSHTYATYGNYTITCDGTSIPNGSSSAGGMFGSSFSSPNYYCSSIRLGESVINIGSYAFYYCCSLTSITLPSQVFNLLEHAFESCYSLKSITIPINLRRPSYYAFNNCYSLKFIVFTTNLASIYNDLCYNCYSLKSITIPRVKSIGAGAFCNCYSITSITMPDSVISIGSNTFFACYSITRYDFTSATTIPTLSHINAFTNINGICKIIVPDALYDEWIVATNWATYADYIYKASEVEVLDD